MKNAFVHVPLYEFVALHREEIIRRCQAKVASRTFPLPTEAEITHSLPLFLDQMVDALRLGLRSSPQIERSAVLHGHELVLQGFTVSQVVQDYGEVCQTVTGLAVELNTPIATDDFSSLDLCLDEAIAGALTEYGFGHNQSTLVGTGPDPAHSMGTHRLPASRATIRLRPPAKSELGLLHAGPMGKPQLPAMDSVF